MPATIRYPLTVGDTITLRNAGANHRSRPDGSTIEATITRVGRTNADARITYPGGATWTVELSMLSGHMVATRGDLFGNRWRMWSPADQARVDNLAALAAVGLVPAGYDHGRSIPDDLLARLAAAITDEDLAP